MAGVRGSRQRGDEAGDHPAGEYGGEDHRRYEIAGVLGILRVDRQRPIGEQRAKNRDDEHVVERPRRPLRRPGRDGAESRANGLALNRDGPLPTDQCISKEQDKRADEGNNYDKPADEVRIFDGGRYPARTEVVVSHS